MMLVPMTMAASGGRNPKTQDSDSASVRAGSWMTDSVTLETHTHTWSDERLKGLSGWSPSQVHQPYSPLPESAHLCSDWLAAGSGLSHTDWLVQSSRASDWPEGDVDTHVYGNIWTEETQTGSQKDSQRDRETDRWTEEDIPSLQDTPATVWISDGKTRLTVRLFLT